MTDPAAPLAEPSALSDPNAERVLLGSILLDSAALPDVEGAVRVEHLAVPAHRTIYAAMLAMAQGGTPVDLVTLRSALADAGELEEVGGATFLAGLVDELPRLTNLGAWSRVVRDKARRRAAIAQAERFLSQLRSGEEVADAIERHLASTQRLLDDGARGTVGISDVLRPAMLELEAFVNAEDGVTGIPTGLPDVDRALGGWQPGRLYIVAARTGRGKSAFCGQVAVNAASSGHRVHVFSMEMEPYQLASRMLLADAEVDRWTLKPQHRDHEYAWARVSQSYARLNELPITFDQRESPSLAEAKASTHRQYQRGPLGLVVVDYLQRMTVDPKLDRWLAVGDLAKGLKSLARKMRVAVLAACQLNAEAEDKRPTLAMLGQAQSIISAEADVIALMHPDDIANWKTQDFPIVNMLIDKNRSGPTMAIPLLWEKACARFVSVAKRPQPQPKEAKGA